MHKNECTRRLQPSAGPGIHSFVPLPLNSKAPDFDLVAHDGRRIHLGDFAGKKNVVLFFYPGDFTPVCTKESCQFRDMYDDLASTDTEVVGVSHDDEASHKKFAERYKLTYPLLTDEGGKLAELYRLSDGAIGKLSALIGRTRRVTYVIDKKQNIKAVLTGELSASGHTEGALEALKKLRD